jgi:Capsule polysaccharide biosynthesis protein
MTNLMIFTRRNTTARWKYIAERLVFTSQVTVVGLLNDGCDVNVMPSFYHYYKNLDDVNFAEDTIGADACQDIIQRCRLLRNTEPRRALKMIGAMWLAFDEAVKKNQPDLLVSFLVDFYPADILQRLLKRYGVNFIGLSGGILQDTVTFSAVGEYNFVREPTVTELDSALSEMMLPTFAPSVVSTKKYDFSRFVKTKLFWHARSWLLSAQTIRNRDALNPEYMTTPKRGDDYYVRWHDRKVVNYMDAAWAQKLQAASFDKLVFVGLQYNPECSTDYWVQDIRLADWMASLVEIARVLTQNGFTVLVKDHPVMFGLRRVDIYEKLSQLPGVVFVPYEVRSQELIEKCKTTFTWTGTIGIQAVLAGRCAVVSTTYYRTEQDFIPLDTWEDIASLPARIDRFKLPQGQELATAKQRVIYQLCSSTVPAGTNWVHFQPHKADLAGTHSLIDSLNLYLPRFIKKTLLVKGVSEV